MSGVFEKLRRNHLLTVCRAAEKGTKGTKGCLHCRRLGYRGRLGVFEVIRITPKLTHLIQKRVPLDQLRKGAREDGMKMLYDSALDKVRQGLTSLEAALTVTMAEEE